MKTIASTILTFLLIAISVFNKPDVHLVNKPTTAFFTNKYFPFYSPYDYNFYKITKDTNEFSNLDLYEYILKCKIQHPKIVYVQAVHETGGFKSNVFKKHNNLFGFMKDSITYKHFDNWKESVQFYKKWQDKRYKKKKYKSYYEFLTALPYAEDSTYVQKLKSYNDKKIYVMINKTKSPLF